MAYLPPPPTPLPRGRRPPRWSPPDLTAMVARYAEGDRTSARQVRRTLVPVLTRLAEAGQGDRYGRQAVAQTAVSVGLAGIESGTVPVDPVAVAFLAVAHVVEATGHRLPVLPRLARHERSLVRVVEVELADPERLARALAVPGTTLDSARSAVAARLDVATVPDSDCPGWQAVRRALRDGDDGAADHRATCGRCTLVAELLAARRHRLWPGEAPPSGPFGPVFDPPH